MPKFFAKLGGGISWFAALGICAVSAAAQVRAEPVSFAGKTIILYVGVGEGAGAVDLLPRALAPVLSRTLPGAPDVIVAQMPGAGGVTMANFVEVAAPDDGTAWGFPPRTLVLAPLLGQTQARFDPMALNWIGSPSVSPSVAIVWAASTAVVSLADAARETVIVGATSPDQDDSLLPRALNEVAGTKFKVINGYRSPGEIEIAMEKGEVQGLVGTTFAALQSGRAAEWLRQGKARLIAQFGRSRDPALPDVPTAAETLSADAEGLALIDYILSANSMGYPAFVSSRVSSERVAAIREAYAKSVRDPEFVARITQMNIAPSPVTGEALAAIVRGIFLLPQSVRMRANALMLTK
jgi:tripartite-type tricarboxylate transporter receptor subunit TctC